MTPLLLALLATVSPAPQAGLDAEKMAVELAVARHLKPRYLKRALGLEEAAQEFATIHEPTGPPTAAYRTPGHLARLAQEAGAELITGRFVMMCSERITDDCLGALLRIGVPKIAGNAATVLIYVYAVDHLGGEEIDSRLTLARDGGEWKVTDEHAGRVALLESEPPGERASRPVLRVWTSRAIATVLDTIGARFEDAMNVRLEVTSDLPTAFARRAAQGEPFDLLITGSTVVDEWIREGKVIRDSHQDIARSGIGVAVRAGAPKPDISTVEAFKRSLLAAPSIAYLPVGSGIYVAALLDRLGIAQAVNAKATRPATDIVSEMVARGEAAIGLVVITQILTTPGVDLVGPLPREIQSHVTFTGAVGSRAESPATARLLLLFLATQTAQRVIRAQGMEPRE